MTNLQNKIVAGVATGALIATSVVSSVFAETALIENNGRGSDNTITVENTNKVEVTQTNTTVATINLNVVANTGKNKANDNTGNGGVSIDTGNARTDVVVTIGGNANVAELSICGCPQDSGLSDISNNGRNSTNKIKKDNKKTLDATSNNTTVANITGTVKAKTGKNKANDNTGSGAKEVKTGNANQTVEVTVEGSTNSVVPTP